MTVRNLESLFAPRSVAVIGASNREHSVGAVVTRNLLRGGFTAPVMPVNRKHRAVAGFAHVDAIPGRLARGNRADRVALTTPPRSGATHASPHRDSCESTPLKIAVGA